MIAHPNAPRSLAGLRVLLVEDEMMLAMMAEDTLTSLGCSVVAASRVAAGLVIVGKEPLDVAFLDVNVAGVEVYPIAEELTGRGIPFVFATGYGQSGLRRDFQSCRALEKPYRLEDVEFALLDAIDSQNLAGRPSV